ncbi:hypothetical protein J3Q64DRAFT_1697577 [Phycomyces blakesleeanus]|uniref:Uncharacterized protein n=1 Tax=Phycomyces blakesleeanus TaxID=4837 RepID=A0ABR3B230_PHYBL
MLEEKTSPPPKAINILRPSSPFFQFKRPHLTNPDDPSHSSSTASSIKKSKNQNQNQNNNNNSIRVPPTILNPSNFASGFPLFHTPPSPWNQYTKQQGSQTTSNTTTNTSTTNLAHSPASSVTVSQRFMQRPRSFSNLSRLSVLSSFSVPGRELFMGDRSSLITSSGEEEVATQVVARIKHGTIMNGRGEFVSKGEGDDHLAWLDEARMHRKIADLEIEKASLLTLNTTLEVTSKLPKSYVLWIEIGPRTKQDLLLICLIIFWSPSNEGPLTPESEKQMSGETEEVDEGPVGELTEEEIESDPAFQRLRTMLQDLIDHAQKAVILKTKISGKVLTNYQARQMPDPPDEDNEGKGKERAKLYRRSWSPPSAPRRPNSPQRQIERRGSDGHDRHGRLTANTSTTSTTSTASLASMTSTGNSNRLHPQTQPQPQQTQPLFAKTRQRATTMTVPASPLPLPSPPNITRRGPPPMMRTLSQVSSPPVLVSPTSAYSRAQSRPDSPPAISRAPSPRPSKPSQLRKSQDREPVAKWYR